MLFGKIVVSLHCETPAETMRIIAKKTLAQYAERHPQVAESLEDWYEKTSRAVWHSLADIKQTFNSVDYVGNQRYGST